MGGVADGLGSTGVTPGIGMSHPTQRLLLDMNLSHRWIPWLARHGLEAIHWRSIGPPNASDHDVLAWAASNHRLLVTCDLDFGQLILRAASCRCAAILLRLRDVSPEQAGPLLIAAVVQHREAMRTGGIVIVEASGSRCRVPSR